MAILVLWGYHLVNYLIPLQCWHWNCVFFLFQINHLSLGRSAFLIKTPFFTSKVTYTLWKKYDYKGFIFSIYRNQYWVGKNVNECDAHICIIRDRVGAIRAPPRGLEWDYYTAFCAKNQYFGAARNQPTIFWSRRHNAMDLPVLIVLYVCLVAPIPSEISVQMCLFSLLLIFPTPDAALHRKSRPLHLWLWQWVWFDQLAAKKVNRKKSNGKVCHAPRSQGLSCRH